MAGAQGRSRAALVAAALVLAPAQVATQETPEAPPSEAGFLGRQIENALSGPGRVVRVREFEGALSGRATLGEMTFADADGVWLRLSGAVLDWNRAALLRGRLSVQELSAEEITLVRPPMPAPEEGGLPEPPAPRASGFSLPDLPVAVNIERMAIDRLALGTQVLGEAADFTLDGAVRLEGGEGDVDLALDRLDGAEDRIALDAAFSNDSRVLALDLTVREGGGGLIGTALGLPGAPPLSLDIDGTGPLSDYAAVIDLSTDGVTRLAGDVRLQGVGDEGGDVADGGGLALAADVGGDVTALLLPDYQPFFGPDVRLVAEGLRGADGALDLERFALTARSLELTGSAAIGADGQPESFALDGRLADPAGGPLRLPVAAEAFVDEAVLSAGFDAATGEAWMLDLRADGVETPQAAIAALTLAGGGTITDAGDGAQVTADLDYAADGLALADDALAAAVGARVDGTARLRWAADAPFAVETLTLGGADYRATVSGTAETAERTLRLDGTAAVSADDLSRFSAVAGQDLAGQAEIRLAGSGDVLGGLFDVTLDLAGDGLSVGQEVADRFLDGPVTLSAAARRDLAGTELERLDLDSPGLTADASGRIGDGAGDLTFDLALTDVSLASPDLEGALRLTGAASEAQAGLWDVDVALDGPYDLTGTVAGRAGLTGETAEATDVTLDLALPDIGPLVPQYDGPVRVQGSAAGAGPGSWRVDLDASAPYDSTLAVAGTVGAGTGDVTLEAAVPDVSAFVEGIPGAVALDGTAREQADGRWQVDLDAGLPYDASASVEGLAGTQGSELSYIARVPDLAAIAPGVPGNLLARGTATQAPDGVWDIRARLAGPWQATAEALARVGGGRLPVAEVTLDMPDVGAAVPALSGALQARATAEQTAAGAWEVGLDADGPYAATLDAEARVGGPEGTAATARLALPDIAPLVPGQSGPLTAEARVTEVADGAGAFDVDVTADGPAGAALDAQGRVGGGATDATATIALPDVSAFLPAVPGALALDATARQPDPAAPIDVTLAGTLPYGATAEVTGQVAPGASRARIAASLPALDALVPGLPGGLDISGTVEERANGYALDLATTGPGTGQARIAGTLARDAGSADLTARGSLPLGLADLILTPLRVEGDLDFDLALNGAPGLGALSGTVSTAGTRFDAPQANLALTDIALTANLAGGQATLDGNARSTSGGTIALGGGLTLAGAPAADIAVTIDGLVLEDPVLFRTTLDGRLTLAGPLDGGAVLGGVIDVGRTELRIPSGGVSFSGSIPPVRHVGEQPGVFRTLERAGLLDLTTETGSTARATGGGEGGIGLDLTINAPQQIFLRGRGLDAELGGGLEIGGTARAPEPLGEIEVIRGRLALLGQRLDLEPDSRITLSGDLRPILDMTASSERDDLTILIAISGPVDDPQFAFTSAPPLPEDEVLAQFFFGSDLGSLSAFQAAQLAASVARLTGAAEVGVIGRLREGLGVDDLNVTTDAEGNAAVTAGAYLSENIYTDVTTSSAGSSEVNINIDLTDSVTVKGSADNEGETTLGIFFQRDY